MSVEPFRGARPAARARTCAPPASARLAQGSLEDALERLLAARAAEAREAGRAEGREAALSGAAGALEQAALRLDASREAALAGLAPLAVELALEIARALLRVEVPAGRYDLEGIVRETLALSGVGRGRCVVHLNPDDAAALAGVRFRAGTEIEGDEAVPRGSVHVTTPHGLLVRGLDEAVRSIGERLMEECR